VSVSPEPGVVTGGVVPVSGSPEPGVGVAPGVRGGLAAVAPGAPAGVQPVVVLSSASQGNWTTLRLRFIGNLQRIQAGSGTPGYQIGEMIKRLENIFLQRTSKSNQFDIVLVCGNTNSTFAGALAAMRTGIKVGHVEAGTRSFDRRMLEEINRILTDQLSDYLFAPTRTAVCNLKREAVSGKIFCTGDLSVEVLRKAVRISS
jgi:hypothetical protein